MTATASPPRPIPSSHPSGFASPAKEMTSAKIPRYPSTRTQSTKPAPSLDAHSSDRNERATRASSHPAAASAGADQPLHEGPGSTAQRIASSSHAATVADAITKGENAPLSSARTTTAVATAAAGSASGGGRRREKGAARALKARSIRSPGDVRSIIWKAAGELI